MMKFFKMLIRRFRSNKIIDLLKSEIENSDFLDYQWIDKDTCIWWDISCGEKVMDLFRDKIKGKPSWLCVEYWKDEDKIKYLLTFDDDTICVNNVIECDYLNNLVRCSAIE